jgi:hypothetical protein
MSKKAFHSKVKGDGSKVRHRAARREHSRAGSSADVKRLRDSGASSRTAEVVAIQRAAGNAVVRRLIQRQADAGTEKTETEAEKTEKKLNDNGITISSSGNCRDKTKTNCTSVDGIRTQTVDGIIAFRNAVGVDLVMTGGTETGHASGKYSHANGYKVDIALNDKVAKYIKDNYTSKGTRSDGAELYEDDAGNEFALEGNHWDITFK